MFGFCELVRGGFPGEALENNNEYSTGFLRGLLHHRIHQYPFHSDLQYNKSSPHHSALTTAHASRFPNTHWDRITPPLILA
jgi:hypothetical protein